MAAAILASGCRSGDAGDGNGSGDDATSLATQSCEQFAAYLDANRAEQSGTGTMFNLSLELAARAADRDVAFVTLKSGLDSRREASDDLDAALEEVDTIEMRAALDQMGTSNEAVAEVCEPLGVTIPLE